MAISEFEEEKKEVSKSTLIIDTPRGCVFCPLVKIHGFSAFSTFDIKKEYTMSRQPYIGFTCPFCNGLRYAYDLTDEEVLSYKNPECPLRECEEEK